MPVRLGNELKGFIPLSNKNFDKAYLVTTLVFQQGFVRTLTGIPPLTTPKATIGKDMINYKIYGNTVQGGLPAEYQRVEYLESSGTQYIDTGLTPASLNGNYAIEIGEMHGETEAASNLVGTASGNATGNSRANIVISVPGVSVRFYTNKSDNSGPQSIGGSGLVGQQNHIKIKVDSTNQTQEFRINDDTVTSTTAFISKATVPWKLYTTTAASTAKFVGKIYYARFYDGDSVLARNFIPCYRKSDNKPGMYDLVTNTFYTNAGTGEFTVGANVYPTPTAPIEIESVGDRSKNLLPKGTSTTSRGITYTVLDDGRVRITGTATSTSFWGAPVYLPVGNYAVSGCPSGGGTNTYRLDVRNSVEGALVGGADSGSGGTLTISTAGTYYMNIRVASGYVCPESGLVLSPMVVSGSTPLPYEPYGYQIPVRSNGLPSEYRQVEYLTLTGTQYINTGFKANTTTTTYHTGITISDLGTTQGLFGSRGVEAIGANSCNVFYMASNYFRADWAAGAGGAEITAVPVTANAYYEITCSRPTITLNGQDFTYTNNTSVNQAGNFLIGSFTSGTGQPYASGHRGRIYFGKLYSNGQLVRDFVPAVRTADNKPGMYDTVTGQFYTNAGTGEFAVGATVSAITLAQPLRRIAAGSLSYTDHTDYEAQKVYRQVGVKVLDGTEAWLRKVTSSSTTFRLERTGIPAENFVGLSSHFRALPWRDADETVQNTPNSFTVYYTSAPNTININCPAYTTVDDFKAFLAAQYAAGTPVTIVYPLATATEESVSLPALPTERGATTTVDVATEVVPGNVEIVYRGR